jgi:hypothetical protein
MKVVKSTWKTLTDTLGAVIRSGKASLYPLLSYSIMLLITFTAILPVLVLFATPILRQGAAAHDATMIRLGLSIMLLAISAYTQLSGLANAIIALAAYRYATARKSDLFPGDPTYAEDAFAKLQKKTDAGAVPAAAPSDARPATNDPAN